MQYFCRLPFLRIACVISTLKVNPSWCFNGLGSKMAQFQHVGSCLQRKGCSERLIQDLLNGLGRVERCTSLSCGVISVTVLGGIFTSRSNAKFSLKKNKICKPGKQLRFAVHLDELDLKNQQSSCLYKNMLLSYVFQETTKSDKILKVSDHIPISLCSFVSQNRLFRVDSNHQIPLQLVFFDAQKNYTIVNVDGWTPKRWPSKGPW